MLKKGLGCLWGLILHSVASIAWGVAAVLQFIGCLRLGYSWVYAPMAAAPGARDGTGLLFVGLFVLVCAGVVTATLCSIEAAIIQRFLPDWEPPGLDD